MSHQLTKWRDLGKGEEEEGREREEGEGRRAVLADMLIKLFSTVLLY